MRQIIISDIVKEYPDMLKIVLYHNDYTISLGVDSRKPRKKRSNSSPLSLDRSIRKTKTTISDIIACNNFELWTTFTFDPAKYDRYDINRCKFVMSMWLHAQRKHSPDFQYLIVPEFHKRCFECSENKFKECPHSNRPKAVHFHALLKNFNGRLKYTKYFQNDRRVYNLSGYRSGYSTAIAIGNYQHSNITNKPRKPESQTEQPQQSTPDQYEAISKYITKYITKDMPIIDGKKRYWCSRNLIRPQTHKNAVLRYGLFSAIKSLKPDYINSNYEVFNISKTSAKLDRDFNMKLL